MRAYVNYPVLGILALVAFAIAVSASKVFHDGLWDAKLQSTTIQREKCPSCDMPR